MYMYMQQAYRCHRHRRSVANSLWKPPPHWSREADSRRRSGTNALWNRALERRHQVSVFSHRQNIMRGFGETRKLLLIGLMDLQFVKLFWICCLASVPEQAHCPLAFVCWTVWSAQACVVSEIALINQQSNAHRTPTWKMKSVMMTNSNSKSKQMYGHAYR